MRTFTSAVSILLMIGTLVPQLTRGATPATKGWLGLGLAYPPEARSIEGKRDGWLYVGEIMPGSPAAAGGIHVQDVITKINGRKISFPTEQACFDYFAARKPGEPITFTVVRQGKEMQLTCTVGDLPARYAARYRSDQERTRSTKRAPSP